jgi:DNA-binding NarL/FixJ family response regulator
VLEVLALQSWVKTMEQLSVLLVNACPPVIQSVARFLTTIPRIGLVSLAASGEAALRLVDVLEVDLVLLDLSLPDINGLTLTTMLKAQKDDMRIIILGTHDNSEYRLAVEEVQADGFIVTSDLGTQLIPLVEKLFN